MAHTELEEEHYYEHPYTPNRRDNYLPNRMVISNTQFSRVEQRLFEYFINQIDHNSINIKHGISVKIPITKIRETVKVEQVLAVTRSMAQKVMTFFDMSKSHIEFKHVPLFSSISFNEDNSGYLEFRSNAQLSPYLASLGTQYTRYDFKTILAFRSIYSTIMYKIVKLHLGQNRTKFIYSIDELRRLFQVEEKKYTNLNDFKKYVLEPARKELASTEKFPIVVEYEHLGNKQRNVTHLEFTIVTQWELSQLEQQEYRDAVTLNPSLVYAKLEEIIDQQYLIKKDTKQIILSNPILIDKFVTIHIEFENGLHPKVKNKTAYILACLDLVKKKTTRSK